MSRYLEVHTFYQEDQVNGHCAVEGNENTEVEVVFPFPPRTGKLPRPVYVVRTYHEREGSP